MKLIALTTLNLGSAERHFHAGQAFEAPAGEAQDLIAAGLAVAAPGAKADQQAEARATKVDGPAETKDAPKAAVITHASIAAPAPEGKGKKK